MQILQTQQNRILKIAAAKFPDLKIKSIAFVLANSDGTSRIPYKQDEQGRQDENAGTGCTNTIEQDNPAEITENSENQAQSLQENVEDVLAAIKNEELRDLLRQLEKKIRKS